MSAGELTYRRVHRAPPELVWIEPEVEGGMRTSITFTDLGDGRTEVTTHQTNVPEAYLSAQARAGIQIRD